MMPNDRHRVFKSLETDKEFIERVKLKYKWYSSYYCGPGLDGEVWESFKMQRRIIERSTEQRAIR